MKTILVSVDFSKDSLVAARYAIGVAKNTGAALILLNVFETPVIYSAIPLSNLQLDFNAVHDVAAKKLKDFHKSIKRSAGDISIELILAQGLPSARVNEIALERKVDMIVIGKTGKGLAGRVFLGSNAARIIKGAPCLVMVVPLSATFRGLKKIVYSTDLSSDSIAHTKAIIPLAKKFNSEIVFLHVNSLFERPEIASDAEKLSSQIKKHIRYSNVSGYISNDDSISDGIDNFLNKHKASCLAMYTHHYGLLGKLFHKSITKRMSFHTTIPLLVIHESDYQGK